MREKYSKTHYEADELVGIFFPAACYLWKPLTSTPVATHCSVASGFWAASASSEAAPPSGGYMDHRYPLHTSPYKGYFASRFFQIQHRPLESGYRYLVAPGGGPDSGGMGR